MCWYNKSLSFIQHWEVVKNYFNQQDILLSGLRNVTCENSDIKKPSGGKRRDKNLSRAKHLEFRTVVLKRLNFS